MLPHYQPAGEAVGTIAKLSLRLRFFAKWCVRVRKEKLLHLERPRVDRLGFLALAREVRSICAVFGELSGRHGFGPEVRIS